MLKFRTPHGIGTIQGDHVSRRNCYVTAMRLKTTLSDTLVTSASHPIAWFCPSSSDYQPHICIQPFTITTGIAQQNTPYALLEKDSSVDIFSPQRSLTSA
ncbi:unnamed protein product [Prunus armeniaca]|uniref:Uncharacterized protein n=1 Tax=Prunus armeniaca TaxID=36596 RepID=A0A6J5UJD2_PRUAR|nr:unnamed protein product [Prunus armeniaca]